MSIALVPTITETPIQHPAWCTHCTTFSSNVCHEHPLGVTWKSTEYEPLISVCLEQNDEFHFATGEQMIHQPLAKIGLSGLPCWDETPHGIDVDFVLTASECRYLAAQLLDAASRIELDPAGTGGAR